VPLLNFRCQCALPCVICVDFSIRSNFMGAGGRRDPSEYTSIICEVFYDASRRKNGVRPVAGQPFPNDMKVECAKAIRTLPLGTKVKLSVVETEKEGSRPFLYSSYKWAYDIVK
ncbi:TPA: hypothetical protein ACMDUA_005305, partial [Vibrio harveyi]